MNKQEIRKQYLEERQRLTDEEYSARCELVAQHAIDLIQQSGALKVHLFLPITKNKEVNTWPVYRWLMNSALHTPIISKTRFKKNELSHHVMTKEDKLKESRYGIPEPVHDHVISLEEIDLVFVPLLAFDTSGNRVGYGAGFYDRFLAQCRKDTLKVGLAISKPLNNTIETNQFDIPLDRCITHERVYDFTTDQT